MATGLRILDSASHGGEYEDGSVMDYNAVYSRQRIPKFQMYLMPPLLMGSPDDGGSVHI
jgi:hypothetical protein